MKEGGKDASHGRIGKVSESNGLLEKPKKMLDGALKMVKGENTAQLVEQFTAEMTLVAEGLCEDQSRLHQDVEKMMADEDRRIQKLESRIALLEKTLEDERAAHDRDLTDSRTRLAALEKQADRTEKEKDKKQSAKRNAIRDITVLVGIAGGSWVLVTLLNLIRSAI